MTLPFNKVCELEGVDDPEMAGLIAEVCAHKLPHFPAGFPRGSEHRKDWEVAMAVRALGTFGALRPDASILGVAAGTEDTLFYLTTRVKQVFATDRYLMPGDWSPLAPPVMLVEPDAMAPMAFDLNRLVVQHMDGRSLRYPDDTFDGIFSSGSIEHFGDLNDAANAAYEMGRVLKPGGVLALSTEFQFRGPPGGLGWPGTTLLFDPQTIRRYIIEASGLELVDDLDLSISAGTLSGPQNLNQVLNEYAARLAVATRTETKPADFTLWHFPHLLLEHEDYLFGSIHLTMRKTDRYPVAPNAWARPPASTLAAIREYNLSLISTKRGGGPADPPPASADPVPVPSGAPTGRPEPPRPEPSAFSRRVDELVGATQARRDQTDTWLRDIDHGREEVDQQLDNLAQLAKDLTGAAQARGLPAPEGQEDPDLAFGVPSEITLGDGTTFTLMVDSRASDPVALALMEGRIDPFVTLMLELVGPGDRILDLGAHVGMFALAAAARGCEVIAVEASPTNAALLRSAVARNGFHNCHVLHAAVSNNAGTVEFVHDGPFGRVAWEAGSPGSGQPVSVPAVTVDALIAEYGWPGAALVKLDVEGSEILALEGMENLLNRPDAPPVLYESNGHTLRFAGVSTHDLIAKLEALGYTSYLVDIGPRQLTRIAAGEMQPQTVADCLAVKRRPPGLDGWLVAPTMTRESRVSRILIEGGHDNPDCRVYVAGTLASEPELLADPRVARVLDALREDRVAEVRAAAAWSAPNGTPVKAGGPAGPVGQSAPSGGTRP